MKKGKSSPTSANMKGFLQKYVNPALVVQEKGAWGKAVLEKHTR